MKGNEAMAEAAIQAGCDAYFGYPITPQAELLEWMARRMPEEGRAFVQAESEIAAISMGLGAAATGARVLVSSSSPGISLMAEAMSYMAAQELPLVLINVMRGGPGLGSIQPSQADYFQAVKGHGHGDYKVPVLAPGDIPEAIELIATSFELAERYRTPVMLLTDGTMGQAMEPVDQTFRMPPRPAWDWTVTGADGRPPRVVKSLHLHADDLEKHNHHLAAKYREMAAREVRWAGHRPGRRGAGRGRLRHRRPHREHRGGPRSGRRPQGRPVPTHHAVPVPDPGAAARWRPTSRASWSSSCRWARWSRTSSSRCWVPRPSPSSGGPAARCPRPARS